MMKIISLFHRPIRQLVKRFLWEMYALSYDLGSGFVLKGHRFRTGLYIMIYLLSLNTTLRFVK